MGLFSFLKSDTPVYSDKIWKEGEYAIKGMMTDALQAITKNEIPVVFTFFADTHQQVLNFLAERQVPYFEIASTNLSDAATRAQVVFLADANRPDSFSSLTTFLTALSKKKRISVIFYGHYPIPSSENKVLEKLMPLDSTITFYSSLDDPAFMMFGGDQLKSTLEKLGLKNEEAIEHAMVTRAMKNAREKIEQHVRQEVHCSTEAEWYSKNYKERKN